MIDDKDRVRQIWNIAYSDMEKAAGKHIYTSSFSDFYYTKMRQSEKTVRKDDLLFCGAPHLFIAHEKCAGKWAEDSKVNCNIAATYFELLANLPETCRGRENTEDIGSRSLVSCGGQCAAAADTCPFVAYDKTACWTHPQSGESSGATDATIVAVHMMLEAVSIDLGTVWISYFDESKARELLRLPDNWQPVCMLYIAYPAEDFKPNPHLSGHRKPLSETCFYNKVPKE